MQEMQCLAPSKICALDLTPAVPAIFHNKVTPLLLCAHQTDLLSESCVKPEAHMCQLYLTCFYGYGCMIFFMADSFSDYRIDKRDNVRQHF